MGLVMTLQEAEEARIRRRSSKVNKSTPQSNVLLIIFLVIGLLIQRIVITRSFSLVSIAFVRIEILFPLVLPNRRPDAWGAVIGSFLARARNYWLLPSRVVPTYLNNIFRI